MLANSSYSRAFGVSIGMHFVLVLALIVEFSHPSAVLKNDTVMQISKAPAQTSKPAEIVKAVSINQDELTHAVNDLKQTRLKQAQAQQQAAQRLKHQAHIAKQARLAEERQLAQLKQEAAKLIKTQKKAQDAHKQSLQKLAQEQEQARQKLNALQLKQQQLAAIEQKQQETMRLKELEAKRAKEQAQKAQEARMMGEVNKYKALIINAISEQWILPEHTDNRLSSQFRIRLAPDGTVKDVLLTRTSGNAILDRSAQTAIYKASPLPVPQDPATFNLFREISLTVKPEHSRG
ncbi:MAG: protein TolA [Legionellaceae bacterium]|nr:protein TolA [Legionellaceae bacterium]HAF86998.1 cell envelope integrity protein TolA [Legionellales bacterium]HCA89955.1 cell envelope integrity protein TolA [Legionellales bacterium]|tara:strand:- start:282 stop:1154 length:873 start_codon:yes stop_codon:yes gene_type:complete